MGGRADPRVHPPPDGVGVNIHYDEWFSQASIEDSEAVAATVGQLQATGLVWEEDGALWLNTAAHGDPERSACCGSQPIRAATTPTWPATSRTTGTSSWSAGSTG